MLTVYFREFWPSGVAGSLVFIGNASAVSGEVNNNLEGALPILIQSGAVGILAFVLWHIFSTIIPRLMDSHESALKAYREELAEGRQSFKDALEALAKK